jgi:PBP1b-binding outer membrane lipoprotein LpoB
MKKIFQYALLLALILILQSCATLADARKAEGEGVRKVYKVSIDKSWNAIFHQSTSPPVHIQPYVGAPTLKVMLEIIASKNRS